MGDRKLPDKAIDVIDEAGASMMLLPPDQRKQMIDVEEVEEVVSRMARIPAKVRLEGRQRNAGLARRAT